MANRYGVVMYTAGDDVGGRAKAISAHGDGWGAIGLYPFRARLSMCTLP